MKDQSKNKQVSIAFYCKEYRNYKKEQKPLVTKFLDKWLVSDKIK